MTLAEHIERVQVPIWTPFGELLSPPAVAVPPRPANDNISPLSGGPLLIGLTGKRNVGKSTVAEMLKEEFGFERIHTFEAGKRAAQTWFEYVAGDLGWRMVYGDLKDQPSPHLPGGVAPRYFLEKFGRFMGVELGQEWTIGLEVALARKRNPRAPIVVESVVYEVPWFRAQGGRVVRLERPGHDGPVGVESDAVQAAIAADATIAARDVDTLLREARKMVQAMMGGF